MQSAFSRHVLTSQIEAVALLNPHETKQTEMEVIFNDGKMYRCVAHGIACLQATRQCGQITAMLLAGLSASTIMGIAVYLGHRAETWLVLVPEHPH